MSKTLSKTTLKRLDIQGFDSVDEKHLTEIAPWLGLTFGICAALAAVGTALASPLILLSLAPFAVLGAILPVHPFDHIYNLGIRRLTGTAKLPPRGAPNRFACGIGSIWMVGTAWLFQSGMTTAGYIVGGTLVAVATLVATTDICIPSMTYRAMFGPPRPREDAAGESAPTC